MIKTILILGLLTSVQLLAFPQTARHGYTQCAACHVSPTGGGVLNAYGRTLARELISTWGYEGEEDFLHGFLKTPEYFHVGGDIRSIQTYSDSPELRQGDYFLMQADAELATLVGPVTVVGTAGIIGGPTDSTDFGKFISRRHYVLVVPTDFLKIRAGKFKPAYGINMPNHSLVTRKGLGFDAGTESYNVEASLSQDNWDAFITGILGRNTKGLESEKGMALTAGYAVTETNKVGVSGLSTHSDTLKKEMTGLFGILGLTEKWYWMTEVDYVWLTSKNTGKQSKGFVTLQQVGYNITKGFDGYVIHQISYLNLENTRGRNDSFGLGFDFFPRPHLALTGQLLQDRQLSKADRYDWSGFLILHYYL